MKTFLAILLVGLTKWPSFELYWSTAVLFKCQVLEICHRTSFWEFLSFSSFWQFNCKTEEPPWTWHTRSSHFLINSFMLEKIFQGQDELVKCTCQQNQSSGAWKPGHYPTQNRMDVPSKIKVEKPRPAILPLHTDTLYIFPGMTEGQ